MPFLVERLTAQTTDLWPSVEKSLDTLALICFKTLSYNNMKVGKEPWNNFVKHNVVSKSLCVTHILKFSHFKFSLFFFFLE